MAATPVLAWKGGALIIGRVASQIQTLVANDRALVFGGEDFVNGNPAQPCLRLDAYGRWRFRWALAPGNHSFQVNVLQAVNQTPRPTAVIKSNSAIGIAADITVTAVASTGWVTMGPVLFTTTTAIGVTWVELHNNVVCGIGKFPCYWDHVIKA